MDSRLTATYPTSLTSHSPNYNRLRPSSRNPDNKLHWVLLSRMPDNRHTVWIFVPTSASTQALQNHAAQAPLFIASQIYLLRNHNFQAAGYPLVCPRPLPPGFPPVTSHGYQESQGEVAIRFEFPKSYRPSGQSQFRAHSPLLFKEPFKPS